MNRIACHSIDNSLAYVLLQEGKHTFRQVLEKTETVGFGAIPPQSFLFSTTYIEVDFRTNVIRFATDALATKPLFYAHANGKCWIDSHLGELVKTIGKVSVDTSVVAQYLDWDELEEWVNEATFYNEIKRVLPSYTYFWKDGKLDKVQHWQPKPKEHASPTDFKNSFIEWLATETLGQTKVAANLSGGLDSSSVVAALSALGHPTHTFYFDAQTAASSEQPFAELVAQHCQTTHTALTLKKEHFFEDYCEVIRHIAQPDPLLFPSVIQQYIFQKTKENDIEMIFSGHGGDSIIGYGFVFLDQLFTQKKWKKLQISLTQRQLYSPNFKTKFFKTKVKSLWKKGQKKEAFFLFFRLKPNLYNLFITLLNRKPKSKETIEIGLNPDFRPIKRHEIRLSFAEPLGEFESNFSTLTISGNEIFSLLANPLDIYVGFPFLQKELLEISMGIPLESRFYAGKTRGTIREAFKELLPSAITQRTSKAEFGDFMIATFHTLYDGFLVKNYELTELWKFIDKASFETAVCCIFDENFDQHKKVYLSWQAMRVISLAVWLDETKPYRN